MVPLSVDEVTLDGLGPDLELELAELEPLEPFLFVPSEFESSGTQSGEFFRTHICRNVPVGLPTTTINRLKKHVEYNPPCSLCYN